MYALQVREIRGVRVDDGEAADASDVDAGQATAGIGIPDFPFVAADMLHQQHDVAGASRGHPRRRYRARKLSYPIGSQIKFWSNPAEDLEGRSASTVSVRAASGAPADDLRLPWP